MKKSGFLKLNASDLLKGLLVAVITALLTGLYALVQAGAEFNWITLNPVVLASVGAGLSYLIKNLFTNSDDQVLTAEKGLNNRSVNGMSRILILAVLLSGIGLSASGQVPAHPAPRGEQIKKVSPWSGFFKPVDKNLLSISTRKGVESQTVWLFRPTVEVSAMQFLPSKTPGVVFEVATFQSAGMGLSYQHYVNVNDVPYNNYGLNLLLLFDQIPRETTSVNLSLAGTVNALQFLNFGVGYNFGMNKIFLLTGLTYNFN